MSVKLVVDKSIGKNKIAVFASFLGDASSAINYTHSSDIISATVINDFYFIISDTNKKVIVFQIFYPNGSPVYIELKSEMTLPFSAVLAHTNRYSQSIHFLVAQNVVEEEGTENKHLILFRNSPYTFQIQYSGAKHISTSGHSFLVSNSNVLFNGHALIFPQHPDRVYYYFDHDYGPIGWWQPIWRNNNEGTLVKENNFSVSPYDYNSQFGNISGATFWKKNDSGVIFANNYNEIGKYHRIGEFDTWVTDRDLRLENLFINKKYLKFYKHPGGVDTFDYNSNHTMSSRTKYRTHKNNIKITGAEIFIFQDKVFLWNDTTLYISSFTSFVDFFMNFRIQRGPQNISDFLVDKEKYLISDILKPNSQGKSGGKIKRIFFFSFSPTEKIILFIGTNASSTISYLNGLVFNGEHSKYVFYGVGEKTGIGENVLYGVDQNLLVINGEFSSKAYNLWGNVFIEKVSSDVKNIGQATCYYNF